MGQNDQEVTRREFLITGAKIAAVAVGIGSTIGLTAKKILKRDSHKIVTSENDIESFSQIDPSLIRYKEVKKISTGLKIPRAITISNDDQIYIALDEYIQLISKEGYTIAETKLNGSPRCLTVSEDGDIYLGIQDHIEIYNSDGKLKSTWKPYGKNSVLTSVVIHKDNVFIADAGNRIILNYDIKGNFKNQIGKKNDDRNIPGFKVPSPYFDLKISPEGLLIVTNPGRHRIEAYNLKGDFEYAWGNPSMSIEGFCGCCNPINFDILPDGNYTTCEKGIPRVKIYRSDGSFEGVVAGPETFISNSRAYTSSSLENCKSCGLDVATDSRGRVFILDPVEKVVRIFDRIENI